MKRIIQRQSLARRPRPQITAVSILTSALVCWTAFSAEVSSWWTNRNVMIMTSATNDYAPVNAGQLKWTATKAYEELQANLPGGAGSGVAHLVSGFLPFNNYVPINLGQLKYVAEPFWACLIENGWATSRPWTVTTTDDADFAMANVGQLKTVFHFELTADTDNDGMPNWWEWQYGLNPTNSNDATNDLDGDGVINLSECQAGLSPTNSDTDADGASDSDEVNVYHSSAVSPDSDGDGLRDGYEITNRHYQLIGLGLTWSQAMVDAVNRGGHLASICSTNEANAISNQLARTMAGKTVWIGLTDERIEKNWRWITTEPYGLYTNWAIGEPNNSGDEDYVMILGSSMSWSDASQSATADCYLLEREFHTDPTKVDSDGDYLIDGANDTALLTAFTNGVNTNGGLYAYGELSLGADPRRADTDRDGAPDGWEVKWGLNPLDGMGKNLVAWWPMDDTGGVVIVDGTMNEIPLDGVIQGLTRPPMWKPSGAGALRSMERIMSRWPIPGPKISA